MKRIAMSVVVTAVVVGGGCASFRAGQLSPVPSWPPAQHGAKRTVSVAVSGEAIVNGKQQGVSSTLLNVWRDKTVQAYRESGLFSEVLAGTTPADRQVDVQVLDRGSGSTGAAVLTGLTFYLIPSKATDELTVSTTIRDGNGKILGSYKKSETVTMWQQFFLIFAMPFKSPGSVGKGTLLDLSRATITEAHVAGVL